MKNTNQPQQETIKNSQNERNDEMLKNLNNGSKSVDKTSTPIEEDDDEEEEFYVVEKILKKKPFQGNIQYLVKWQGYSQKQNTWEPISNLVTASNMLYQYEYNLPQTGVGISTNQAEKKHNVENVEKIFGHRLSDEKKIFLVSFKNSQELEWLSQQELPKPKLNEYIKFIGEQYKDSFVLPEIEMDVKLEENMDQQDTKAITKLKQKDLIKSKKVVASPSKAVSSKVKTAPKKKANKKEEIEKEEDIPKIKKLISKLEKSKPLNSPIENKVTQKKKEPETNSNANNNSKPLQTPNNTVALTKTNTKTSANSNDILPSSNSNNSNNATTATTNNNTSASTTNNNTTSNSKAAPTNNSSNTITKKKAQTEEADTKKEAIVKKRVHFQDEQPTSTNDSAASSSKIKKAIKKVAVTSTQSKTNKGAASKMAQVIKKVSEKLIEKSSKEIKEGEQTKTITSSKSSKAPPLAEPVNTSSKKSATAIKQVSSKPNKKAEKKESIVKIPPSTAAPIIDQPQFTLNENNIKQDEDNIQQNQQEINIDQQQQQLYETNLAINSKEFSDVEGSFEAGDIESKVTIRSLEKDIEDMIFEVFWKPRLDGKSPKSKLVKYSDLKKNAPYKLIYWLEVMVRNSVRELEANERRINQLLKSGNQIIHPLALSRSQDQIGFIPSTDQVNGYIPQQLNLRQLGNPLNG